MSSEAKTAAADTTSVALPPPREAVHAQVRMQLFGNLLSQIHDLETDKAVLAAALDAARQRIAELEQVLAYRPMASSPQR